MTVIISTAMVLSDTAILKAVHQNSQANASKVPAASEVTSHGRNFSVNLPYPSKPTLRSNISSLQ